MKVLVTGSSGFIGGHVVDALLADGHEVVALVRPRSDRSLLRRSGITCALGDMTDPESLERAARGTDAVFHTAALVSSYGSWEDYRRVGVEGTENVVGAAVRAGVPRFVHFGSIAVYGFRHRDGVRFHEEMPFDETPEDWNHYVREKVLSEKVVWRAHATGKIAVTSLRPSIVIGPRDRNVVTRMMTILRMPLTGTVGLGGNRVACVVVQDLAAVSVAAAKNPAAIGRAYNISGRGEITQRTLVRWFADSIGRRLLPLFVPYPIAFASTAVLETAYQVLGLKTEPPVVRLAVPLLGRDFSVDCTRAARELGFRGDGDYERAVRDSVDWYVKHVKPGGATRAS